MGHKLIVTVHPDGRVEAHTAEVTGEACVADVALVESIVGHTAVDSRFTADYFASSTVESSTAKGEEQESEIVSE